MQRGGIRHWPFESKYLEKFEIVEEQRDGLRLFPHTEQLPLLSKAINQEFTAGLTTRLAATNESGDTYRKLELRSLAQHFCQMLNGARPDHLLWQTNRVRQSCVRPVRRTRPDGHRRMPERIHRRILPFDADLPARESRVRRGHQLLWSGEPSDAGGRAPRRILRGDRAWPE